jgi:hypothetical protein
MLRASYRAGGTGLFEASDRQGLRSGLRRGARCLGVRRGGPRGGTPIGVWCHLKPAAARWVAEVPVLE